MRVHCIMGTNHSGKTFFRKSVFPESYKVFDIFEFQAERHRFKPQQYRLTMQLFGYEVHTHLAENQDDDVIVEFCGINEFDRNLLLPHIESALAEGDSLIGYWVETDYESQRVRFSNEDLPIVELDAQLDAVDIRLLEESCFDSVFFVRNSGSCSREEQLIEQARFHLGYAGEDAGEAREMMSSWLEGSPDDPEEEEFGA